jgi:hypothetical protein
MHGFSLDDPKPPLTFCTEGLRSAAPVAVFSVTIDKGAESKEKDH